MKRQTAGWIMWATVLCLSLLCIYKQTQVSAWRTAALEQQKMTQEVVELNREFKERVKVMVRDWDRLIEEMAKRGCWQ